MLACIRKVNSSSSCYTGSSSGELIPRVRSRDDMYISRRRHAIRRTHRLESAVMTVSSRESSGVEGGGRGERRFIRWRATAAFRSEAVN